MIVFHLLFYSFILFSTTLGHAEEVEHIAVVNSTDWLLHLKSPAQQSLGEQEIQNQNLLHAEELWDQFSNLNTASGSNRIRYIKIRGIGERSEYDTVPSNSVGVFYDHIDLSGFSGVVAPYDVEEVEVLKGPQTFLFGDSSVGGNIHFKSSEVTTTRTSVWSGWGSQNHRLWGTRGLFSLSDRFSVKAGVQKNDSDGFYKNTFQQKHTSSRDETFANFGSQWMGSRFSWRTSHILAEQKNGNDVWNTDQSFLVHSDNPGQDNQLTHGHSIIGEGSLDSRTSYLSILSYSASDILNSYDEDWNNNAHWQNVVGWNKDYDYFKAYRRKKYNGHAKIFLQNRFNAFDLTYGLHYYQKIEKTAIDSFKEANLRSHLDSLYRADKLAFLINGLAPLWQGSQINFSLRSEKQWVSYSDTGGFQHQTQIHPLAFNLAFLQNWGRHEFQSLVSRGFKGGGVNPEINLLPEQQSYDPEYVMNYETSWKVKGNSWQQSLTLFIMDRRDHQITTSRQNDPTNPSDFTFFIDNAARSAHFGIEEEWEWDVFSFLSLKSSLGFLQAEFRDYELQGLSYRGRPLAHSPAYTFALTGLFRLSQSLTLVLNGTGKDSFHYSNTHEFQSQAYETLNASLHWQPLSSLQMSLWIKNALNRKYSQRGFYFANEPPIWQDTLYQQNGTPQEWGLRAQLNF